MHVRTREKGRDSNGSTKVKNRERRVKKEPLVQGGANGHPKRVNGRKDTHWKKGKAHPLKPIRRRRRGGERLITSLITSFAFVIAIRKETDEGGTE